MLRQGAILQGPAHRPGELLRWCGSWWCGPIAKLEGRALLQPITETKLLPDLPLHLLPVPPHLLRNSECAVGRMMIPRIVELIANPPPLHFYPGPPYGNPQRKLIVNHRRFPTLASSVRARWLRTLFKRPWMRWSHTSRAFPSISRERSSRQRLSVAVRNTRLSSIHVVGCIRGSVGIGSHGNDEPSSSIRAPWHRLADAANPPEVGGCHTTVRVHNALTYHGLRTYHPFEPCPWRPELPCLLELRAWDTETRSLSLPRDADP